MLAWAIICTYTYGDVWQFVHNRRERRREFLCTLYNIYISWAALNVLFISFPDNVTSACLTTVAAQLHDIRVGSDTTTDAIIEVLWIFKIARADIDRSTGMCTIIIMSTLLAHSAVHRSVMYPRLHTWSIADGVPIHDPESACKNSNSHNMNKLKKFRDSLSMKSISRI